MKKKVKTLSNGMRTKFALALVLSTYVPVIEWYQETDPMLHSLPLGRGTVVVARYAVAFLGMSLGLLAVGYGAADLAGGPAQAGTVGLIPPPAP